MSASAKIVKSVSIQISKDLENFKKTVSEKRRTKNYVNTRLETLQTNFKRLENSYYEVISDEEVKSETLKATEDWYNEASENYTIYRSLLLDEVDKFNAEAEKEREKEKPPGDPRNEMFSQKQHEVRLPKIHPPIFTGEYENWRSFHDQYVSLVHNNATLTKIEKLHYLKSSCKEGAGVLLEHISVDDASYDQAWELLKSRYDFKRILVNNELKLFYELPVIREENSKGIRELLDNATKILHALKNLELPVHHWDAIVIFLLLKKLPASLQSKWETQLGTKKDIPTFKEFSEFLETKFRALEMMDQQNEKHHTSNKRHNTVFHVNADSKENFACKVCHQGVHSLRTCSKFLRMDASTRQRIVRQQGNCFNCLAYSHQSSNCPSSKRCHFCQRNHNSLLHLGNTNNLNRQFSQNPFNQTYTHNSQMPHRTNNNNPNNAHQINRSQIQSNSLNHAQQHNAFNHSNSSNQNRTQTHHVTTDINPNAPAFQPYDFPPSTSSNCFHLNEIRNTQILLATAIVKVKSAHGTFFKLRALIDPGSQASFITESAAQLLGLKKHPTSFDISVLGQKKTGSCQNYVELSLHSNCSDFVTVTRGFIFKTLTGLLPSREIIADKLNHIQGLKLADPTFHIPARIDLLLGSDVYCEVVLPDIIRSDELVAPIAQKTEFGWIILGKAPIEKTCSVQVYTQLTLNDVDTEMRKFWEIEESPYAKVEPEEDVACENHFLHNIKRLPGGRFEVALPFKGNQRPQLKSTQRNALNMFLKQEQRLLNNPTLHKEYSKCITEYLELRQMEEVDIQNDTRLISPYHYVVPHHAVIKESSTTTKLRVVFNAAFKTSDGSSLNDHLMTGPKTQTDILSIMLKWRTYKITFTSDIEKMYRQIKIHPEDAYYQLIYWREDPSTPIKLYKIQVLMFGTAPAPYLANRTLKKLAADEESTYPLAAKMIREEMYIDDLVSGADSLEEAKEKYNQISKLLLSAGFHLRKWMSNDEEFLNPIPADDRETNVSLTLGSLDHTKTLGISWYPSTDSFSFQEIAVEEVITKRTILSTIARIFDPLGWIAPCVIKAKILMQQLWLSGVSWDDTISVELQQEWLSFREELKNLKNIRIPRWINTESDVQKVEFHGFSDASTKAYGAVVYIRLLDGRNRIHTHLLISKTKVAPVNTVSLPRLELCGAVLLAKLLKYTQDVLPFKNVRCFTWTDSTITLCWISALPSRWKTFIANRITEIQRLTNVSSWKHIPTKLNPADLASRGTLPSKLIENELWWEGPSFLQESWDFSIPAQPIHLDTEEEKRVIKVYVNVAEDNFILDLLSKHEKLNTTLRIIAFVKRCVQNSRIAKENRKTSVLTPLELDVALRTVILIVQQQMFPDAICELKKSKQTKLNKSLNLFIDQFGIIRIGGRLENSMLTYDQKHPIALKSNHRFAQLIIEEAHHKTLHGGTQQVVAHIRNKFWIFGLKRSVKKHLNRCIICFKAKPKALQQLMGDLPAPRVNISRPFTHTGVDYAGPIEVRAWKGRNSKKFKGYFAIFICLSTKAIHLEAVTDLTTQAFIAAFRRFTSRRGLCSNLYSDCGTNFQGANAELQMMLNAAKHSFKDIANSISQLGTKWNFIPPASPHFGGLWEAGVKSVKYHLRRIAQNQALTFEELSTLLAQIEACLNSRPLCPVTDSLDDYSVLTPAHFLIGTSSYIVPESDSTNEKLGYLDRWARIQATFQTFWKEWSGEYLTRLQNRPKWFKTREQPKIGDLVLLFDERFPPSKWPLARIIDTYPGKDNLIRVVKVKTQYSEFKRPIAKICPLPSNTNTDESTIV